jgi:hypothetical protein
LLLANALRQLSQHYEVKIEDLPERLRTYWQGRVSSGQGDGEALQEEQELLEGERAAWRSERHAMIQQWLGGYQAGRAWQLALAEPELDVFVAIINDRRLILSVEFGVTDADMDRDPEDVPHDRRRQVLWEIHLLALFLERILAALRFHDENQGQKPDPADEEEDFYL